MHEARPKADGVPFFEIVIDPTRAFSKMVSGRKELAVVVEVMNADFKAVSHQPFTKFWRDAVIALGNEIEARSEAQFHLQSGEGADSLQAFGPFHIVGQGQGEFFAVGPTGPAFRGSL